MTTNHLFGMYFTESPLRSFVMDDFGNAIWISGDVFMQAVDFIVTGAHGYSH